MTLNKTTWNNRKPPLKAKGGHGNSKSSFRFQINKDWVQAVFNKRPNQCSYLKTKGFCKNEAKENSSYCQQCSKKVYVCGSKIDKSYQSRLANYDRRKTGSDVLLNKAIEIMGV